jgi:hypothetical protein
MNTATYPRYPTPSAAQQSEFLLRLYFGSVGDPLDHIIDRAYLDLSRTVHGIGAYQTARPVAAKRLRAEFERLSCSTEIADGDAFDDWHEKTCELLRNDYAAAGYIEHKAGEARSRFTVGQAQKWINMALKYVYVFGESRLPGYEAVYRFCHVPIDNIVLKSDAFNDLPAFHSRWSRIDDYKVYLAFQVAVRSRYPTSAPLAVEFWAWQGSNEPRLRAPSL